MRIIQKRPHVADCFMTPRGSGVSPWVLDRDNPTFYGDKNGGRTGLTNSWLRMRCNDPKCTALALVHHWDLAEVVQESLT